MSPHLEQCHMLYAIYCLKESWCSVHKQPWMPNSVATLQTVGNNQGPPPPPISNPTEGKTVEENLYHDMQPVIRKAKKVCGVWIMESEKEKSTGMQLEIEPRTFQFLVRSSYHWATRPLAETSLVMTARLEVSADFSRFSLSHSQIRCLIMNRTNNKLCTRNYWNWNQAMSGPSDCVGVPMELTCSHWGSCLGESASKEAEVYPWS